MPESNYECGAGWNHLIDPIVAMIKDVGGTVDQVKEKYGTLRIYYTPGDLEMDDSIDRAIAEAQEKSATTCELCGKPASLMYRNGWYSTLCPQDAKDHGYKEKG